MTNTIIISTIIIALIDVSYRRRLLVDCRELRKNYEILNERHI